MSLELGEGMDIDDYPFLSPDEFSEACHHLDSQYCRANLGALRRQWKLRICTALDMTLTFDGGYTTYVQIIRPLETEDDLDLDMDKFSISEPQNDGIISMEDGEMADAEESDKAVHLRQNARDTAYVTYEIHLHPTYRVPCLWFGIHGLPLDEPTFNIDTVFRRLVPDEYKGGLRGIGGISGISADHHPVTGVPSFFVHPCLLGDAILQFSCSRKDYLTIWLGLVGGCVGLWVPKEMAIQ